ncbi:H-2 class I histocompatibility antigen, Q10 alpha chain-like isoform X2, partial [Clarias magur]
KLQYLYTAFMPGTNVTVDVLLDGRLLFYYDSKMETLIHKLECLNRSNEDVWKLQKDWIRGYEQDLTPFLSDVMEHFNQSE